VLLKLILAAFLFAHGMIHMSYLMPRPPATASGPSWPFALDRSWVLSPLGVASGAMRVMGLALALVTVAAFTVAAASVLGVVPQPLWTAAVAVGAASSLGLLVVFFHPWLVVGLLIDLALLGATLIARWTPDGLGGS
jgi:hypothetical protein